MRKLINELSGSSWEIDKLFSLWSEFFSLCARIKLCRDFSWSFFFFETSVSTLSKFLIRKKLNNFIFPPLFPPHHSAVVVCIILLLSSLVGDVNVIEKLPKIHKSFQQHMRRHVFEWRKKKKTATENQWTKKKVWKMTWINCVKNVWS